MMLWFQHNEKGEVVSWSESKITTDVFLQTQIDVTSDDILKMKQNFIISIQNNQLFLRKNVAILQPDEVQDLQNMKENFKAKLNNGSANLQDIILFLKKTVL